MSALENELKDITKQKADVIIEENKMRNKLSAKKHAAAARRLIQPRMKRTEQTSSPSPTPSSSQPQRNIPREERPRLRPMPASPRPRPNLTNATGTASLRPRNEIPRPTRVITSPQPSTKRIATPVETRDLGAERSRIKNTSIASVRSIKDDLKKQRAKNSTYRIERELSSLEKEKTNLAKKEFSVIDAAIDEHLKTMNEEARVIMSAHQNKRYELQRKNELRERLENEINQLEGKMHNEISTFEQRGARLKELREQLEIERVKHIGAYMGLDQEKKAAILGIQDLHLKMQKAKSQEEKNALSRREKQLEAKVQRILDEERRQRGAESNLTREINKISAQTGDIDLTSHDSYAANRGGSLRIISYLSILALIIGGIVAFVVLFINGTISFN